MPDRISRPATALLLTLLLGTGTSRAQEPGTVLNAWVDQITSNDDAARGMTLYPDGRFLVEGTAIGPSGTGYNAVTVRYNPDGTRDPSFGGNGTGVRIDDWSRGGNDYAECVTLQADGKVVIAGSITGVNKNTGTDGFAARYLADGTPDPSFGTGGRSVFLASKTNDRCYDAAIQADGKIVVVGIGNPVIKGSNAGPDRTIVARLLPNGALDTSFASGGVASLVVGTGSSGAGGVAIQADGKIVVGGDCDQTVGGVTQRDLFVVRLNSNGVLDSTFGAGGVRTVRVPGIPSSSGVGGCLTLQDDGKIVLGGASGSYAIPRTMTVVRLNTNGSLDATFNGTGIHTGTLPGWVYSLTVTDQGDIATCGPGTFAGVDGMVVARFTPSGALDTSRFNAGGATPGYVFRNINVAGCAPFAIAYRPNDNTILVCGRAGRPDGSGPAYGYLRIQN